MATEPVTFTPVPVDSTPSADTSVTSSSLPPPPTSSEPSLEKNGDDDASQVSQDEEDMMLAQLEADQKEREASKTPPPLSAPTLLGKAYAKENKKSQLDFLLNKASEYSQFIAGDLKDLQNQMAEKAAADADTDTTPKGKKRSKNSSTPNKATLGSKAIFTQPRVLAKGCLLKDYQLEGVRWLASLYENGVSGILADEMGLGKTIQVIGLLAHLMTVNVLGPFMVVAPLATLPNWVREFEKWLPSLPVVRYHGSQAERNAFWVHEDKDGKNVAPLQKKNRKDPRFPVIVTSYEVAIRDMKKLSSLAPYQYMIVDEGQRLKNRKCCLIKNLKMIRADNRLLLSGTPIQNNLDELWSLLNFVNPQIFDDLNVFQSWFGFKDIGGKGAESTTESEILAEQGKDNIVTKLHEILRPFLLRRVKMDVLKEMPPKKEIVVYAGMSQLQRGYAANIANGVLREELMKSGIEGANMTSQINTLMNHRKNSNHPFLFGEPIDPASGKHVGTAFPALLIRASGKFNLLDRMLTRLFKAKHQVLIFSQMTEVLSIIEDYLVYRNWKYCRIDGSTKIDDRQRQMDLFNAEKFNNGGARNNDDDRLFVFLLSTRAGGLGINLASADTCIIFDSDWNPHQDSQAMDRCHRIGQTLPVAVYRLLTAGSVDMTMMEKAVSKKKLDRMTIAGGDFRKGGARSKSETLSTEVLKDLLADDIANLREKTDNVENVRISEEELNAIMDREQLFPNFKIGIGAERSLIPEEGKMYDIIAQKEAEGLDGFDGKQ